MTHADAKRDGVRLVELRRPAISERSSRSCALPQRIFSLALHIIGSSSEAMTSRKSLPQSVSRAPEFEGRQPVLHVGLPDDVNARSTRAGNRARREDNDDARLELAVAVDARSNPSRTAELRQTYARLLRAPTPPRRHAHDGDPRLAAGHVPRESRSSRTSAKARSRGACTRRGAASTTRWRREAPAPAEPSRILARPRRARLFVP